jgi:hypothetical protein
MNTSITTKLAALALALLVNSLIMGSVAVLFSAKLHESSTVLSVASLQDPPTMTEASARVGAV